MKTQKKLGFLIHQSRNGAYAHLHFTVLPLGNNSHDLSLEIRFQTDDEKLTRDASQAPWYGPKVHVTARDGADLARLSSAYNRAEKALETRMTDGETETGQVLAPWNMRALTPENLVWALTETGIARCVYDARVSEHVAIGKLADPSLARWQNKHVATLARCEHSARKAIKIEMAQSPYVGNAELADWLASGAHVTRDDRSPTPTVETLEKLFRSPFAPLAPTVESVARETIEGATGIKI